MLTEFIQFKLIKSHPQLPKKPLSKCFETKLSLQQGKNLIKTQPQLVQALDSRKLSNKNQNIYTQNFGLKIIDSQQQSDRFKKSQKPEYYPFSRNSQDFINNSRSKIPLILSPKKLSLINKQQKSLGKQVPLISSPIYKQQAQNRHSQLFLSSDRNQETNKITALKTLDTKYLLKSNGCSQNSSNKSKDNYLFRSTTHENLSPIKHKLDLMRKNSNVQTLMKKSNSTKRIIEKSDSFRHAIQKSRQKRKVQKQNIQKISNIQKVSSQLNNQYYSESLQNLKKLQNAKKKYSLRQKIIQDPKNKQKDVQKQQKLKLLSYYQAKTHGNSQQFEKPINFIQKKVDSFIEQSVNNSNLVSLCQIQERALNMDPY